MNDQHPGTACPHRELAVGWALRSLEPAEESLVAAHMPECPSCTRTAAEAGEVGANLGLSIPEATPSAALEQRILQVTGARRAGPVPPPPPLTPSPSTPPARHITALLRLRTRELAVAAVAILVAAAVVLGVRVAQLGSELNQEQRQVTAMSEALQSAANPATARVPLVAKGGSVVGMVLASPDRVAVVSTHLPSNRVADQTYVLWGLTSRAPIPLATFDVASQAPQLHPVPTAIETETFTGYAVSLEPGRRAPAAPTDVVAGGQVAS